MISKSGSTPKPVTPLSEGARPKVATPAATDVGETFAAAPTDWKPGAKPSFESQLSGEIAQVKAVAVKTAGHAKSIFAAMAVGLGVSLTSGCATTGALHGPVNDGLYPQTPENRAYETGRQIHDHVKPMIDNGIEKAKPYVSKIGQQTVQATHEAGQFFKGLFGKP